MKKVRALTAVVSSLFVFAGTAYLASPAHADSLFSCSSTDIGMVAYTIAEICGENGGYATVTCSEESIEFQEFGCY